MKNGKKYLTMVLVFALIVMITGCTSAPESNSIPDDAQDTQMEPKFIKIAAGASTGTWFALANALASYCVEDLGWVASAESTSGTPAEVKLLGSKEVEFAFLASVTSGNMYLATKDYEGEEPQSFLRSICYLYPEPQHLIVNKNLDINSIYDVVGHRIAIGAAGSNTAIESTKILSKAGISLDDITPEYVMEGQAVELLKNRQCDGVLMSAPLNASSVLDLMSVGEFKIVSIPEEIALKMKSEESSAYIRYTIPAGFYEGQDTDITTLAGGAIMATSEYVDEETVYQFTKLLFERQPELAELKGVMEEMNLESITNMLVFPIHPGAVKYFKEQGLTDADLQF